MSAEWLTLGRCQSIALLQIDRHHVFRRVELGADDVCLEALKLGTDLIDRREEFGEIERHRGERGGGAWIGSVDHGEASCCGSRYNAHGLSWMRWISKPLPAARGGVRDSAAHEGEQVGVDDVGMGGGHAMRQAGIGLDAAVLEQFDSDQCRIGDGDDLVVLAM